MAVKYFGQYLLEKCIIKSHELIDVVKYQATKNLKFGEYALSKGFLNESDLARITNLQKRLDKKIGEIAQDMGILTPEQVEEILTMQKNDHILLGEALIQKEFLTRDVVERELSLFKEDQGIYETGTILTPEGVKDPDIIKDIVDLSQKMLQRMAMPHAKVSEGFISSDEPRRNFLVIRISLSGNVKYDYVLSLTNEISRLVTCTVLGSEVKGNMRDIIADGVKEFCNIVCGNIMAKLSQKGKNMDITPPEEISFSDNGYGILKGRKAIYYPIVSPGGDSALILIEG